MYSKSTKVATPATATPEFCQALEVKLINHYADKLTPELLIAHRKGCYATVINSRIAGVDLTNTIGTDYAKEMTEAVLNNLAERISTIK